MASESYKNVSQLTAANGMTWIEDMRGYLQLAKVYRTITQDKEAYAGQTWDAGSPAVQAQPATNIIIVLFPSFVLSFNRNP